VADSPRFLACRRRRAKSARNPSPSAAAAADLSGAFREDLRSARVDREFKTIDFLTLLDLEEIPARLRARLVADQRIRQRLKSG
jgi:hypothetical protein